MAAPRASKRHEQWEFARNVILFCAGIVGIFYELIVGVSNPALLIVFAAMLGLPITLGATK